MNTIETLPFIKDSAFSFFNTRQQEEFLNSIMRISYYCVLLGSSFTLDADKIIIDMTKSSVSLNPSNKHNILKELSEIKDELDAIYTGIYEDDNMEIQSIPKLEIITQN